MIPKIRFNEFEEEYDTGLLSDYLMESKERNKRNVYSKEDVLSVSNEFGLINQIEYLGRSYAGENVNNYHVINNGEIVYTKSPLSSNPYGIIKCNSNKAGIVSTLYAVYKCKDTVLPEYIDYYFGYSNRINKYLKPLVNIGAKHDMKINNKDALIGNVYFPKIKEQRKVISFLRTIDKKIDNQRRRVQLLEKRKQIILNLIFENKVFFKNLHGEEYPSWETYTLGDFFDERKSKALGTEKLLSVTISNGVILQSESNKGDSSSENKKNYKQVFKGDIAYNTMRMWQGAEGYSEYDGIVSPAYTVLMPKQGTLSKFFSIMFKTQHMLQLFTSFSQGLSSDNWNLKFNSFSDLDVNVPCKEEQEKIIKFMDLMSEQIKIENLKLLKLKDLKKGFLQQMFC